MVTKILPNGKRVAVLRTAHAEEMSGIDQEVWRLWVAEGVVESVMHKGHAMIPRYEIKRMMQTLW